MASDLINQESGAALERAKSLLQTGDPRAAVESLRQAVAADSGQPQGWKLMAELLLALGEERSALEASVRFVAASAGEPGLAAAANQLLNGRIGEAERQCRQQLQSAPTNVAANFLLATIANVAGMFDDAERQLERCLALDPEYDLARMVLAEMLHHREKGESALGHVDILLERHPDAYAYLLLRIGILIGMNDFDRAIPAHEHLLERFPPRPGTTLSLGHALKTVGRLDDAIAAYRQAIELRPAFGDAYWSLANLKRFRFEDDDLDAMKAALANDDADEHDRVHLEFALGKACQDRGQFDESFDWYRRGNERKRRLDDHDADRTTAAVDTIIQTCTSDVLNRHDACPAPDPIFIVGLPRSGSTLLEQILASHPAVDGTRELTHVFGIVRRLGGKRKRSDPSQYPGILRSLSDGALRALGEEYLQNAAVHRGDAPYFIDKAPSNFLHIGLIRMMLPNARIIDARRHPMAACFSCFTQLFALGQAFTYSLTDVGRYYCDYVRLMDHWDRELPGEILCVRYEDVVEDTETQVRRMLDHCGLPFEQSCLEFYRNTRAVRTPSSEQVRQPIYRSGLDLWRSYESHLDELKAALEPVLGRFPA